MKPFAVKSNPPRYTRDELIAHTNFGFKPEYRQQSEGIGQSMRDRKTDRRRYEKGMARMMGLCASCEYFKKDGSPGRHCRRAETENCVK